MRISDWSSDVCSSDLHRSACRPDSGFFRHSRRQRLCLAVAAGRYLAFAGAEQPDRGEIGRASCRERVCQYVSISVVAVSLKKKQANKIDNMHKTWNNKTYENMVENK